jgi:uncharacterized peroxidase-related enzyme
MSLRPAVLPHFLALNRELNFEPSELDRATGKLLAIAVSAENGARYSLRAHTELLREEGEPEELDARRKALTEFAVKLTRSPAKMGSGDIEALRGRGLSDAAISDAIQEVAFFNYVNRVVTAVGVDDEPDWVD